MGEHLSVFGESPSCCTSFGRTPGFAAHPVAQFKALGSLCTLYQSSESSTEGRSFAPRRPFALSKLNPPAIPFMRPICTQLKNSVNCISQCSVVVIQYRKTIEIIQIPMPKPIGQKGITALKFAPQISPLTRPHRLLIIQYPILSRRRESRPQMPEIRRRCNQKIPEVLHMPRWEGKNGHIVEGCQIW